jgi:hypothetical protein
MFQPGTIYDWVNAVDAQTAEEPLDGHLGAAPFGGVKLSEQVSYAHGQAVR